MLVGAPTCRREWSLKREGFGAWAFRRFLATSSSQNADFGRGCTLQVQDLTPRVYISPTESA